jgi:hypothetical protein
MDRKSVMRGHGDLLHSVEQALLGSAIERVTYEQLSWGGLTGMPEGPVHEVDSTVRLHLAGTSVSLTWDQVGRSECLAVEVTPHSGGADAVSSSDTVTVDVTGTDQWAGLAGREIQTVAFGWQRGHAAEPDDLWTLRLAVAGGGHVVCCLGELDRSERPTYSADGLLVIFDESTARDYVTAASAGSAWADLP